MSSSPIDRSTTSSCGYDGSGVQVARASVGTGRTFLLGSLPSKAARVWMALQDGRVVGGSLFPVLDSVGAAFSLYLLPVDDLGPGEVAAVDKMGLLVDHAHVSTSGEAGRPVGVLDAYANIIGFVPIGDWDLPPPGRPAHLQDIRVYLLAPLSRVLPEVKVWWANRPRQRADSEAVTTWWSAYPVGELLSL